MNYQTLRKASILRRRLKLRAQALTVPKCDRVSSEIAFPAMLIIQCISTRTYSAYLSCFFFFLSISLSLLQYTYGQLGMYILIIKRIQSSQTCLRRALYIINAKALNFNYRLTFLHLRYSAIYGINTQLVVDGQKQKFNIITFS